MTPSFHSPLRHGAHLGQVGPDGLDLIVEDVVLLHLVVHQRQVRPEALAVQLVLGGVDGDNNMQGLWDRAGDLQPPLWALALLLTGPAKE